MNKQELIQNLNQIHRELQNLEDVDGGVIEALAQIAVDIRELAEREGEQVDGQDHADQVGQLQQRVEQLEIEHPTAARFLAQMTDFLAMIGI